MTEEPQITPTGKIESETDTTDVGGLVGKISAISFAIVFIYILLTTVLFSDEFDENVFLFHIGDVYPYFLILGVTLILFGILLFARSILRGHSSLYILTLAVSGAGLSYIFGYLNFDPTGTVNFRQTRLFQLQVLSQTVSVFLFYLHYELSSHPRPRTGFLSLNLFLLWPYSLLNIYYLIFDQYDDAGLLGSVEDFSLSLLQLGVIIIFVWLLYNSIQTAKIFFRRDDKTTSGAAIQLAGFIILVLGVVFQFVETVTPLDVWHTPLNTLAILLIGLPYLKNANVLIFSPINVMMMGVVDQVGRTMYYRPVDKNFAEEDTVKTTAELFGGLTLAFSSMGKEVAKSDKGVDSLQFTDRSIIVEYLQPYYLVVIANRSTYFLQREMEEYLKDLKVEYPQVPKDGSIIPEKIFVGLNKKFFPIIIQT